jgi:hypothetical protein
MSHTMFGCAPRPDCRRPGLSERDVVNDMMQHLAASFGVVPVLVVLYRIWLFPWRQTEAYAVRR